MLSLIRLALVALAFSLTDVIAANTGLSTPSSSRQRCYTEPFPDMLAHEIQQHRKCGLNNPHVVDVVCAPVRGLVPDVTWLQWQLSQFENEVIPQPQQETKEQYLHGSVLSGPLSGGLRPSIESYHHPLPTRSPKSSLSFLTLAHQLVHGAQPLKV